MPFLSLRLQNFTVHFSGDFGIFARSFIAGGIGIRTQ